MAKGREGERECEEGALVAWRLWRLCGGALIELGRGCGRREVGAGVAAEEGKGDGGTGRTLQKELEK